MSRLCKRFEASDKRLRNDRNASKVDASGSKAVVFLDFDILSIEEDGKQVGVHGDGADIQRALVATIAFVVGGLS